MAYALSLTAEQRSEFARAGVLFLPGYFPADDMARMADAVWSDIRQRFGIDRDRPETWATERPRKFQRLIRSGAFRALGSERLFAIGDAFLGAGAWEMPKRFGFPLVTFATDGVSEEERVLWHTDLPPSACAAELPCIRIFTFLEAVRPGGGGTLFVEGSHHLVMDIGSRTPGTTVHSTEMRATLKQEHRWFSELFACRGDELARFTRDEETLENGAKLRVREMAGEPGDLVLMHPAMLHAGAVNRLGRPRLMLTETLSRPNVLVREA